MKISYFIVLILLISFSCQQKPTKQEGGNQNNPSTEVNYNCFNCGMGSQDFPKWHVKVNTSSEETWFCSPRCMFQALTDPKSPLKNIEHIHAKDFYELKDLDAKQAFYVIGSDVLGPMGNDFVELKDSLAAEDFKKDHQGARILRFEEVNENLLNQVVGKK